MSRELAVENYRRIKVRDEGDNPYYLNYSFGDKGDTDNNVETVLGTDLGDEAAGGDDDDDGPQLPEWDGHTRFVGEDGEVIRGGIRG